MRPLRMELEGFARFREPQVISFEELSLFAIAGPTGAGKTLVLDAICFALYGVTPRLSQKLDGLISHGRDRLVVDLQFEVATGTYRVLRSIERKASGTISKSTRLERLADGRWKLVPETDRLKDADDRLQQLVGFDFRAFTRSILLPQGKFDEFLHGDARQRRNLLKELLDLGRLEVMREEASHRERSDAVRLDGISARLEGGGLMEAPGQLRETRQALSQLEADLESVSAGLVKDRERLKEAEEVAALHADLEQVEAALQQQLTVQRQAPALRLELERARLAAVLLPLLDRTARLQEKVRAAGAELTALADRLPGLESAATEAMQQAGQAASELADAEPVLSAKLATLQELRPLALRLERLGRATESGAAEPGDWDEERLGELQALQGRLKGLQDTQVRLDRLQDKLEQLAHRRSSLTHDHELGTAALEQVLGQGRESGKQVEELEARTSELERSGSDAAESLRRSLSQGEPCPVCQQTVHELPGEVGHELAIARQALEQARQRRQQLRERYQEMQASVVRIDEQLKAVTANEAEAVAALTEERTALQELKQEFAEAGLPGGPDELAVQLRQGIDSQLAAAAGLLRDATDGQDHAGALAATEARLVALRKHERQAGTNAGNARHALERLQEQVSLRQRDHQAGGEELEKLQQELAAQLNQAGFKDAADLSEASRDSGRQQELEGLLQAASRELERLTARSKELQDALGGRQDSRAQLAELAANLAALEAERATLLERRGSLQSELTNQQSRLEELNRLLEERRVLEDGREVWKLLARDLQDNNFTDHLLAGMQQRLARHASRIIRRITADRFDLHLSSSREFEVSDTWADGERRTVRSLSGGETFIVSLALALALSEAAAGGRRLGALFLDEGFGTLDQLTLDSVAGVLESLSGAGRMVGIITHVPELSERLPARLLIHKDPEGSRAYWED